MNLERLPQYLTTVAVMLGGIFLALFCGLLAGSGRLNYVGFIFGAGAAMVVIVKMREHIWLLIPLCWPLSGQIPGFPGGLPVRGIAIVFVFIVFLVFKALKTVRRKPTRDWLDILLLINLLYLVSVYVRHPVGTNSLGSERVGGRPYFEVALAVMAYWVMGHVIISAKHANRLPFVVLAGDMVYSSVSFITYHFPWTSPVISKFYTGVETTTFNALDVTKAAAGVEGREQYLSLLGTDCVRALCSYRSPSIIMNPLNTLIFMVFCGRFKIFLLSNLFFLSLFMVLKSGHRLSVVGVVAMILLSGYFRREYAKTVGIVMGAGVVLALVALLQGRLFELPLPAQRALSFMPGKWDQGAVRDAEASTEWRIDIWRNVLGSEKYIQDRWWGDGFGVTKAQLQGMQSSASDTTEGMKENLTVMGQYHSGPLSTIHITGYIGLTLFSLLLLGSAKYAWRLIVRSRRTPFFPLALFFGMAAIYKPFAWTLLMGSFDQDCYATVFAVACLKLVRNSLAAYQSEIESTAPDASDALSVPDGRMIARPELSRKPIRLTVSER